MMENITLAAVKELTDPHREHPDNKDLPLDWLKKPYISKSTARGCSFLLGSLYPPRIQPDRG